MSQPCTLKTSSSEHLVFYSVMDYVSIYDFKSYVEDCGIDSLAAIIERKYKVNLFVPNTLFLFCGRSSSRIKGLLWEGDGFLLLHKRVEQGHFAWPRTSDELRQLHPEQFKWLMQGFAIDPIIYDIEPSFSA